MGKFEKKKQKKSSRGILLIMLVLILAAMACLVNYLAQRKIPTLDQRGEIISEQIADTENAEAVTQPARIDPADYLLIRDIGGYAGMYMEDGTNEPVADVMMLILENTSDQDLQLARINLEYEDFIAEFEVTNLPAGEKVIALEKNRHPEPAEEYRAIRLKNVVFFPEAMGLQEERLRITGSSGMLTVENVSGEDIPSDIYIYYKHSTEELLYGGITYRVSIQGGLKADRSSTVIAGHFDPDTCRLLMADCGD